MQRAPDPYLALLAATATERDALLRHPVYRAVAEPTALASFMETHVFAVWDFMSLLKALQRVVTCVAIPWTPPRSRSAARLVNEMVLGEESDRVAPGVVTSHFELYVEAMREVGADVAPITRFLEAISRGADLDEAFSRATAPGHARRFVERTLATASSSDAVHIAASFLLGREDLVPAMFRRLLPAIERDGRAVSLRLYLERHIEVDEGDHGPMARQLLEELCAGNAARWTTAREAARDAIRARIDLWDGVVATERSARAGARA